MTEEKNCGEKHRIDSEDEFYLRPCFGFRMFEQEEIIEVSGKGPDLLRPHSFQPAEQIKEDLSPWPCMNVTDSLVTWNYS